MDRRRIDRILHGLTAALTVAVAAGQLGRIERHLDMLNGLLLPLLAGLFLCFAAAARLHLRRVIVLALMGIAIGGGQLGAAALRVAEQGEGGTDLVRILTLSTYHANRDPRPIRAQIEAARPDIVLLQETDGTARAAVARLLPGYHRLRSCKRAACSLTIVSRWPLRRLVPVYRRKRSALPDLLVAEIARPAGALRVVNVHLPRPTHRAARRFTADLRAVVAQSRSIPLIVAGDFNLATGSFGLARFETDTGLRRADRLTPTYPANSIVPAFLPIDHVMVNDRWSVASSRRLAPVNSDHYGIAVDLVRR